MKRLTRQRIAILQCLTSHKRPLSVEEILNFTSQEIPDINLSTIYRNLKALIQESKVTIVELPGGQIRYELLPNRHCHHFLCEACNCLFNIPACPKDLMDMVPEGFELRGHSITLSGFCKTCQNTRDSKLITLRPSL